jgi:class 3 adenylate cyclase
MPDGLPHGTVRVLFSDIEGSTDLSRRHDAAAVAAAAYHNVPSPGQALVSHATHALLEGEMLGGSRCMIGERELSGLGSSRVYEPVATSP